jgi:hypothetical protein
MKIRVTLMTENDKPLPEGVSKEQMEERTAMAWDIMLKLMGGPDKGYVESCELVEE